MRKILFIFILIAVGCASKTRQTASIATTPPAGEHLELSKALQMGPDETVSYLKSQTTLQAFAGLEARDPANALPKTVKFERNSNVSPEKRDQQKFIRKFRNLSLQKKNQRAQQLVDDFSCSNALESQALAFTYEIDFPEKEAVDWSKVLHEKVLNCQAFSRQESLFRLALFSIQKNDCAKATQYLDMFPAVPERGVNDRLAYVRSLCDPKLAVDARNPLGGYGILLNDSKKAKYEQSPWLLSTSSGSEDWDRLLVSFLDLHQQKKPDIIRYLASKLNYEKFRELPVQFQTSLWTVMSFNGADLPVFQTLHKYVSEHPETINQNVASLLFPTRYWPQILENSSQKTDPILVKALIRQESAFNPMARSRARAAGLMQLIYPTAKIFGIKRPNELLTPEANIHAGSAFLARLVEDFGSVELALAAYNAGPGIVRQWQKRYPTDNINLFVEMIPYTETREYVRLVQRNYKIYQSILPVVKPQHFTAN